MEFVIASIIGIFIGVPIGMWIMNHKLRKQSNGILMFDRSDPTLAPYLCIESKGDLAEIQTKKFVTMVVGFE